MNQSKIDTDSTELVEKEEELLAPADELVETGLDEIEVSPEDNSYDGMPDGDIDPAESEGNIEQDDQSEEDDSPEDQDTESETGPVAQEPFSESMTFMGLDSTAMVDIASVKIVDDSPLDDWIAKLNNPQAGEKPNKEEAIQEGIEIVGTLTAKANRVINMAAKNFAERAIEIGIICILLKKLMRGSDQPWGVWAENNLPFLGKRNRQKFMRLAKRTDCHGFTHLGVDRMDTVCSLTEGSSEEEPIKALFEKYEIPFDESSEVNMTEFRNLIDAAISNERLIKKGLEVNFDLVKNAVNAKVSFNTPLIKKLKDIKDCDGNPETYVRNLTITQGNPGSDDPDIASKKRFQDFNSLGSQLVKTIDYIVKDTDHIDTLDKDLFINLYEKINALLKASGIEIVKEEEE